MQQLLVDTIKKLSADDRKSLSQKALKLVEEVGTLASNVLPMEYAHGTRHRIVQRSKLLEDVADVMLVALSIAYAEGYDEHDIDEMMLHKTLKWAGLQYQQTGDGKAPHEIHLTIDYVEDLEKFKADCADIGIKPILLDLHINNSGFLSLKDMMTSQVVMDTTPVAFEVMDKTAVLLTEKGYNVVRRKIEVAPWHPAVPQDAETVLEPTHAPDQYFESHIEVALPEHCFMREVQDAANKHGARLSSNVFKRKREDGLKTVMVTLRRFGLHREEFQRDVDALFYSLTNVREVNSVRKPIIEYSIYDSAVSRDNNWMGKNV